MVTPPATTGLTLTVPASTLSVVAAVMLALLARLIVGADTVSTVAVTGVVACPSLAIDMLPLLLNTMLFALLLAVTVTLPVCPDEVSVAAALMLLPAPSTLRPVAFTVTVPALPDPAVLELI
jgi:hypothetical protein